MKRWIIRTGLLLLLTSLVYANDQVDHLGLEENSLKNIEYNNSIKFHKKAIQINTELIERYSRLGETWAQKGNYDIPPLQKTDRRVDRAGDQAVKFEGEGRQRRQKIVGENSALSRRRGTAFLTVERSPVTPLSDLPEKPQADLYDGDDAL